ncbi:hypothetical protein FRB90_012430 [Tulasnella sp. 427]|nr:hypothetical protein FRB90_012430 [Tulasnella sp. 427]
MRPTARILAGSSASTFKGRVASILLDPADPITAPRLSGPSRKKPWELSSSDTQKWNTPFREHLTTRLTTLEAYEQLSTVRMLASPLRRTVGSDQYMPSDFLIRLGVVHQSPSTSDTLPQGKQRQSSNLYILPDGLLHPQFETKRNNRGSYVPCWRSAFEMALKKGQLKRIHHTAKLHPLLAHQISHQLRTRVLQELVLLHKRLQTLHRQRRLKSSPNILRNLTAQEWAGLHASSFSSEPQPSPSQNPLAVIGCPQVPASEPVSDDQLASLPIQVDYPPADADLPPFELIRSDPSHSSEPTLPLYYGLRIFRLSAEQTRLRSALDRIVELNRFPLSRNPSSVRPEEQNDLSDAYLLQSPEDGVDIDAVPLAISLWRLRLWEGGDWRAAVEQDSNPTAEQ